MINKSDRKAIFEGMKLLFFYKKNIIVVYIIMFVGLLLSLVQPQLWGRLFEKISKLQINKDIYMLLLIVFFLSILYIFSCRYVGQMRIRLAKANKYTPCFFLR